MAQQLVCITCGYVGKPKRVTKGNIGIELILWLFFIIPGLIYSAWRGSSRYDACPKCNGTSLVPMDSPVGQNILNARMQTTSAPTTPQNVTQTQNPQITTQSVNNTAYTGNINNQSNSDKNTKNIALIAGFILLGLPVVFLPYYLLPVVIALVVYIILRKASWKGGIKFAIVAVIYVIAAFVGVTMKHKADRVPVITISEPVDGYEIQADKILVKGTVDSDDLVSFTINGKEITHPNGNFEIKIDLTKEKNEITVIAKRKKKSSQKVIIVNRIFTPEEIAERDKKKKEAEAQAKKDAEEQKAQRLAEQKKWDSSAAGKLCKAHPEWTKEECTNLANKKIWIGMSYDMLVATMGRPSSSNPSNYGSGTMMQWCWDSYNMCFYDNNGDKLVDSYN